jgi:diguanylate cyclase (GGDEF)-like protein
LPEALRNERVNLMSTVLSLIPLAVACLLLSLASRQWRTTALPWGTVPLAVAAVMGAGVLAVTVLALVVTVAETAGRWQTLREVVPVSALAIAVAGMPKTALPGTVVRLMILLPAALVILLLVRRWIPGGERHHHGTWNELAATLLLLASATLLACGLALELPLLTILGLSTPAMLPALIEDVVRAAAGHARVDGMVDASSAIAEALTSTATGPVESLAERLHETFSPFLRHRATIVALNPAYGEGTSVVSCYPSAGEDVHRIRERARHALQSGRRDSLVGVRITNLEDRDHLHPAFSHQLLVPLRRGQQLIALLAFLNDAPLVVPAMERPFADAAAAILDHLLGQRELASRVALLAQRANSQGDRLRQLLELSNAVSSSSDPRRVTENLTRTVCEVFGFGACDLLLDAGSGDSMRRVASWKDGAGGWIADEEDEIAMTTLNAALSLGTSMSRAVVVPADAWPQPPRNGREVDLLLVLGLGSEARRVGYLVAEPRRETELPDLDDLRVLEILTEQVTPALSSTLRVAELYRQTQIDGLTGIANRRGLDQHLDKELREARERETGIAFGMIDADSFKAVNDRFGHRIGDVVLRELAQQLAQSVRTMDFVARYGGEEFCIVLPGLGLEQAQQVLERLRVSIEAYGFARSELTHPVTLTVSIGVAHFPSDGSDARRLIERADVALYRAKALGKNRVVLAADVAQGGLFDSHEPFAV